MGHLKIWLVIGLVFVFGKALVSHYAEDTSQDRKKQCRENPGLCRTVLVEAPAYVGAPS